MLPKLVMPIGLMILVLGSIYLGLATPSEAAGVGAAGAVLCAIIKRRLTWANFVDTLFMTMRVSGMVLWIIVAASIFTALYVTTGAKDLMTELLLSVPGGAWGSIIAMQLILFALGCLMDAGGIIVLTTPVFFPVVKELGFDTLWFGLLVVMNMEMAFLTPPFGLNLYFMKGVVPQGVTMMDIYRSVVPFVMIQAVGLIIVMIFPKLATWLPSLMITTGAG